MIFSIIISERLVIRND